MYYCPKCSYILDIGKANAIKEIINTTSKTHKFNTTSKNFYSQNCVDSKQKFKLIVQLRNHLIRQFMRHTSWQFLMQTYVNNILPYWKVEIDYGSCDYFKQETANSEFLSLEITKRISRPRA